MPNIASSSVRSVESLHIIWAFDAFSAAPALETKLAHAIPFLFGAHPFTVQPISILRLDQKDTRSHTFLGIGPQLTRSAQKNYRGWTDGKLTPQFAKPLFLPQTGLTARSAVCDLIRFAQESDAQILVAGTGAKPGLGHRLGHFVELLLHLSPLPVLVVNRRCRLGKRVSYLLFPTDFSRTAEKGYEEILELARGLGTAVILLYHPPAFAARAFSQWDSRRAVPTLANEWRVIGEKAGIVVRCHFTRGNKSLPESVWLATRPIRSATVVGVGPSRARVRIARELVRRCPCPTLVLPLKPT